MGCPYLGLGGMPDKYRNPEWLYHFAQDFAEPARKLADAGMLLMYHNHDFEFRKMYAEGAPDADPNKRMIEYLRKNRFGRATFLPISSVRGRTLTAQERQVLSMPGF